MKYEIYFAVACNIGKAGKINQDNFWCGGKYLKAKNKGLKSHIHGKVNAEKNPAFAVFDGVGGEQDGEVAAYIATSTFDKLYQRKKRDVKYFFADSCKQMNDNIAVYAERQSLTYVGTTAAMVMFGEERVYLCNIGDSKIYRYNNKSLTQISRDHVSDRFKSKKQPLTQFLGIPESEFRIKPYYTRKTYNDNDLYLICSDGLTDMLSKEDIENILSANKDVKSYTDILMKSSLEKGGKDNITIIVCKVKSEGISNNGR